MKEGKRGANYYERRHGGCI